MVSWWKSPRTKTLNRTILHPSAPVHISSRLGWMWNGSQVVLHANAHVLTGVLSEQIYHKNSAQLIPETTAPASRLEWGQASLWGWTGAAERVVVVALWICILIKSQRKAKLVFCSEKVILTLHHASLDLRVWMTMAILVHLCDQIINSIAASMYTTRKMRLLFCCEVGLMTSSFVWGVENLGVWGVEGVFQYIWVIKSLRSRGL